MSEKVNIEFTRDEWHAMLQLIRKQARTVNNNDLAEQKQKIQAKLNSCQMELNRLARMKQRTKPFSQL